MKKFAKIWNSRKQPCCATGVIELKRNCGERAAADVKMLCSTPKGVWAGFSFSALKTVKYCLMPLRFCQEEGAYNWKHLSYRGIEARTDSSGPRDSVKIAS